MASGCFHEFYNVIFGRYAIGFFGVALKMSENDISPFIIATFASRQEVVFVEIAVYQWPIANKATPFLLPPPLNKLLAVFVE